LSWLEFNNRVLHEACDPRTPLLERPNFWQSLEPDEFFVRVALKEHRSEGSQLSPDGRTPQEQLEAISQDCVLWWRNSTGTLSKHTDRSWREKAFTWLTTLTWNRTADLPATLL